VSPRPGALALVLHSHLPWLAHHGAWPVGEEWLHQAISASYLPVVALLHRLAEEGRRDLLTLGVTPVLAAQLDDPWCLAEHHRWLTDWLLRAQGATASPDPPAVAGYEGRLARTALTDFERQWAHGASPLLRALSDGGAVELLGGPATHTFLPLSDPAVTAAQLEWGLDDAQLRVGSRPAGIWTPECALRPGLEELHAAAGVAHLVIDGPTVHGRTWVGTRLGGTDVVALPRDLEVAYRVWSPRSGYPGARDYRDSHTYDHESGLRPARVTSWHTAPQDKRPYRPERAAAQVERDAHDFVTTVARRLDEQAEHAGSAGPLVLAAFDTELFGHHWHEGPAWLERVLRLLPEAGVRTTTLAGAVATGMVEGRLDPVPVSSWGAGKDHHVWSGDAVGEVVASHAEQERRLLATVAKGDPRVRDPQRDALAREVAVGTASDWAFIISHDGAAQYAAERVERSAARATRLADAIDAGRPGRLAGDVGVALHGLLPSLDARVLGTG